MKYIDSHCHLGCGFDDAFARARDAGVWGCVLNATKCDDWDNIVRIAKSNQNVCGAIGIHPWYVESVPINWNGNMRILLDDNPYLIIGEVGLDKTHGDLSVQEKIFVQTLEIAIQFNRAINIHCVHAWDIMLKILKSYRTDLPKIVVHSFDGNAAAIRFDADLYFSYSPLIANSQFKRVRESLAMVQCDKILIESDSVNIIDVLKSVRDVLKMRPDINADDIFNNSMGVFFNG